MNFNTQHKNSCHTAIFVLSLALGLGLSRVSFAVDEAKVHVAGTPNITSFVYHVGKEKASTEKKESRFRGGHGRDASGIQGLIGGSFDYSQMLVQGGAPS